MKMVRVNVTLPKDVLSELSHTVAARQRSSFITEAVVSLLKAKQAARLAADYQEAAQEMRRVNKEMEGALNDGLD